MELVLYRQMLARDVYFPDPNWKTIHHSFDETPHGIYLYSWPGAEAPFYIGKSQAKSYHIVGRVWQELDDYKNGRYWLTKNLNQLQDLSCFRKNCEPRAEFYAPGETVPEAHFLEFLNNVKITFGLLPDPDFIDQVEARLQRHLVESLALDEKWVGDGGIRLSKAREPLSSPVEIKPGRLLLTQPNAELSFLKIFESIETEVS